MARREVATKAGLDSRLRGNDKLKTSWGGVAQWYHDTVEDKGSYQKDLIQPNLLRLMDIKKGETVLDLACGEGFFSRRFAQLGAKVVASDIAPELIAIAKGHADSRGVQYHVAPSHDISFASNNSVDKAVIILAIQNIDNVKDTLAEVARVLKPPARGGQAGKLYLVLNHPAFRVPKESSWGWDPVGVQYRRVDKYLSESRVKIDMKPGSSSFAGAQDDRYTVTLHRPLQFYFKQLGKAGFGVTNMEEWVSEKESQKGPRQEAENRARKEIPLFMCLEAVKL